MTQETTQATMDPEVTALIAWLREKQADCEQAAQRFGADDDPVDRDESVEWAKRQADFCRRTIGALQRLSAPPPATPDRTGGR